MPLVWDLAPKIQLVLATLVQFGPGSIFTAAPGAPCGTAR
jgi:hypothetical protein